MDFDGRVVFITGGASGIGAAAVRLFAALGGKVAIADRNAVAAEELANAVPESIACPLDVTDADACAATLRRVAGHYGRLDCAFNNAGISETTALAGAPLPESHELPLDAWRSVLAVDLDGVFHCLRAELPLLLAGGGGAIVNTTSLQAHIAYPRTPAYTAAKHGVLGLTRVVAREYAGRNIRCNAVSPGVVDTPLAGEVIRRPEYRDALLSSIPIGRFAMPEDIARAAVWLCSDEAAYINGAVLAADGGYLA